MKTEPARVGARGVDSYPYSQGGTAAQAHGLKASGIDFVVLYLGVTSAAALQTVLEAGLAFMPVTLAGHYDGAAAVAQCRALGLPAGCTVWLDLEGMAAYTTPPEELIATINAWADAVKGAGFQPGLYIGSPQPLTGKELYALRVERYWKAPSRVVDRFGHLGEPDCGYCMYQLWPQIHWPSDTEPKRVWVDVDFIQQDNKGRVPAWVIRSPDEHPAVDVDTVRGVQTRLKELGFDPGPIDGVFGAGTRAAVVAFQQSRGLAPDGVVGPKTKEALATPP
jgi:hypothetical protein